MKPFDYQALRHQIIDDFASKQKVLDGKKEKALQTLEQMRELMNSLNETVQEPETNGHSTASATTPKFRIPKSFFGGGLKALIKQASQIAPEPFTRHDLKRIVETNSPGTRLNESSVLQSVKALEREKVFRIVEPSKKNKPTLYGRN